MPDFAALLAWGPTPATANQLLYAGNVAFESEGVYRVTEGSATRGELLVSYESYEDIRGLAWLPDGSGFVYAVIEGYLMDTANVFLYSFASRTATRLTSFKGELAGSLSVSPDGQQIVFERAAAAETPSDLWVMRRDGSNLRLLVRDAASPAWSPRKVVVLSNKGYLPRVTR